MTDSGGRLGAIVAAWSALFRGDAAGLGRLLDERVVWQGMRPELICRSRDEVIGRLGRLGDRPPRITRFEAQESGRRVAVSVDGPDFPANGIVPAGAPRALVFTFDGDTVTRMESFASRDEAFGALDLP